jgi:hypothetical protein
LRRARRSTQHRHADRRDEAVSDSHGLQNFQHHADTLS